MPMLAESVDLLNATDEQIIDYALTHYRNFCVRQIDNKVFTKDAREYHRKLADRISAVMDIRGIPNASKIQ